LRSAGADPHLERTFRCLFPANNSENGGALTHPPESGTLLRAKLKSGDQEVEPN
jgi:hypothetical protein